MFRNFFGIFALSACFCLPACAQSIAQLPNAPTPQNAPAPQNDAPTIHNLPRNLLHDQAGIWTSPFKWSSPELEGGLLFAATAGVLGADDSNIMRHHFLNLTTADHANTASTGLTGLFLAAPVAYYGVGLMRHQQQAEQTGVMAGEAIADSLAVNQVLKIASRRERPALDGAKGRFFQPGVGFDSSFASNHSVVAWSSATVMASGSNSFLFKLGAYGLATGVSATRVIGRDHFPSDVLVGSAVGWMVGRYVYHHHRKSA